ncbi:DUF305 domain-containing protein [Bradyrhizobium cenepequi]|uniref:DUF305 domain-containing protein n=1 Tax=Bradyrhizobium cenepequi TaxID=2821403 RepID=UPI001CE2A75A|nr:DUF305 domain-containing protein [Bradyrhizobium cenepequi]MCA6107661.1 hypothetical protein [Bradyrhizobium cenepequi]
MRVRLPRFLQITGGDAANLTIAAAAVAALTISLWLARSFETPGSAAGIPVVIPHHSAALLTSERAHVRDPSVGQIADGFIEAQQREISAIRQSAGNFETGPVPTDAKGLPLRPGN